MDHLPQCAVGPKPEAEAGGAGARAGKQASKQASKRALLLRGKKRHSPHRTPSGAWQTTSPPLSSSQAMMRSEERPDMTCSGSRYYISSLHRFTCDHVLCPLCQADAPMMPFAFSPFFSGVNRRWACACKSKVEIAAT